MIYDRSNENDRSNNDDDEGDVMLMMAMMAMILATHIFTLPTPALLFF